MSDVYGRDLDLNLLRVFVVVADTGSVTQAASQLYLTQPAVSAALKRLTASVGSPLFARQGRGITLTPRGQRLLVELRPHLIAITSATLSTAEWDPRTSERTVRIGLSDVAEQWLLPKLLRVLDKEAPRMRLIILPIQFRTVADALASRRIDCAVTVADDLPATVRRRTLFKGGFTCLFDPRHANVDKTLTERRYFEHDHVIVSYNGDLRGLIEDYFQKQRRVRCSVSSFANLGEIIEGSALLATVPRSVADSIIESHPKLRALPLPFHVEPTGMELLWPDATDKDDACRFIRAKIEALSKLRAS